MLLVLVAGGLAVWALGLQSDLDDQRDQTAAAQHDQRPGPVQHQRGRQGGNQREAGPVAGAQHRHPGRQQQAGQHRQAGGVHPELQPRRCAEPAPARGRRAHGTGAGTRARISSITR